VDAILMKNNPLIRTKFKSSPCFLYWYYEDGTKSGMW